MPTSCFKSVQGLCLRVTRLDECCNVVTGECAFVTSDSFITLNLTAELEEPDEFIVKLANGRLCINELGQPTLKRYTVEVDICEADPDLFEIIAGVDPVLDFNGDTVGYSINENLGGTSRFALEFWTRVPSDACSATGGVQYLYWLLPCVQNGRVGDVTIENGPLTFSFTAEAVPSSTWGVGPFDVVASDAGGTPSPLLAAIPEDTALHVQLTTIAPPCLDATVCGCQALPIAP